MTLPKFVKLRKRPIALLIYLVILFICSEKFKSFTSFKSFKSLNHLHLMLNQGVSAINCCLTEYYWIKGLGEAIP